MIANMLDVNNVKIKILKFTFFYLECPQRSHGHRSSKKIRW
jgi:hypothetical protein